MRRTSLLVGCGLSVIAGLVVVRTPTAASPPPVPGIVLVCLDTLRADALALDSGRAVRMPRLEAFARDGVAFADAVAPAAWTLPSVTSLLTGLDPGHTGVFGLPERLAELPPSVETIAQRLRRAGWSTSAATSGGWLGPRSPTLRGFEEGLVGVDADPEAVLRAWDRRRRRDAPFLLFVHSLAAHDPYLDRDAERPGRRDEPVPFDGAEAACLRRLGVALDHGAAPASADLAWAFETFTSSGSLRARLLASVSPEGWRRISRALKRWLDEDAAHDAALVAAGERLRVAYEEGLADADRTFGRILDGLRALDLPEGTAVIVVGDHGEAFGEHRTLNHGRRLHEELVRVPLVVHAPERAGAPRVVHGVAGLVDVAPTILALAGIGSSAPLDGASLLDAGAGPLPDRILRGFEERGEPGGPEGTVRRLVSIRTAAWKGIVRSDSASGAVLGVEVFHLASDPFERTPIPLDDPAYAGADEPFRAALDRLLGRRADANTSPGVAAAVR